MSLFTQEKYPAMKTTVYNF